MTVAQFQLPGDQRGAADFAFYYEVRRQFTGNTLGPVFGHHLITLHVPEAAPEFIIPFTKINLSLGIQSSRGENLP